MKKESVYYKAIKGKSEIGTETEVPELFKVAEMRGIQLPSPHLAIFKTVYAKIEESNRNDVRLERSAVYEAMPTLVGKQVNLNHWRKGFICGHIIDANINEQDEIEVTFMFYKDVYIEDFDRAVEQFQSGDLTVSFELYAEDREEVGDGTVRLLSINFAGMGLLLDESPAYPGAVVFEMAKKFKQRVQESTSGLLFAKEITENCDKIIVALAKKYAEDNKNSDNIDVGTHHKEDEKTEKKKDKKLKKKNKEEGGNNMPKLTAEQIKALKTELGDLCKDWTDEDFNDEAKIANAKEILADVEEQTSEESSEEAVAEANAEETEETDEAKVTQKVEETSVVEVEMDSDSEVITEKMERKTETKYEDDGSEVVEEVAEETASEEVEDEASEEEAEEVKEESTEAEEPVEEDAEAEEEEVKEESEVEAEEETEVVKEDEATEEKEADEVVEESEAETKEEEEEAEEPVVEEVVEETEEVAEEPVEEASETSTEELEAKIEELEKALEEAKAQYSQLEASIEDIKANALKIAEVKRVLGDYVKDFSDADFLNPDKIRIATQAKEIDELKGKKKDDVTPEVAADTGHDAEEIESANVQDPVRKLIDIKTSKKR